MPPESHRQNAATAIFSVASTAATPPPLHTVAGETSHRKTSTPAPPVVGSESERE
ncbi:hypothetical protein Hanom_Chr14g01300941 [Helianthus anomalus]